MSANGSGKNRDMQEFEAKILDQATRATPKDQEQSKTIVDRSEVTSVETITPMIAALLFVELNKHNRDFSLSKAHDYAEQMRKGYWRFHHQGLAFYPNRKLADGQHRLAATFLSGTTQKFTVLRNFDEDALAAIDVGTRRTAAQSFDLSGLVEKSHSKLAAMIALDVMKYEYRFIHTRSLKPSIYELKAWLQTNMAHLKVAMDLVDRIVFSTSPLSKNEAGSIVLGMLNGGYAPATVEEFIRHVLDNTGDQDSAPRILSEMYRKAKERSLRAGGLKREEKIALAFKGAGFYALGEKVGSLRWKAGKEPMPSPSPPQQQEAAA